MTPEQKSKAITDIIRLSCLIVLETPQRSYYASQSYVRRSLISDLEKNLAALGYDFAEMRRRMKKLEVA